MYRYLHHCQKAFISNIIFKIYQYSFIILKLKDKSRWLFKSEIPDKVNVIWASGKICMSVLSYKDVNYTFQFNFNLNSKLRLNISILVLHLSENMLNCKYDKLEVYNSIKLKEKYKYCGYHSNFNLYPEFNALFIMITLHLGDTFHLDAVFNVIDKKLIFNPLKSAPILDEGDINLCVTKLEISIM